MLKALLQVNFFYSNLCCYINSFNYCVIKIVPFGIVRKHKNTNNIIRSWKKMEHMCVSIFLHRKYSWMAPPPAGLWQLQTEETRGGPQLGKIKKEVLNGWGSRIIIGLEQTIERGKGCVWEREQGGESARGKQGRKLGVGWGGAHRDTRGIQKTCV